MTLKIYLKSKRLRIEVFLYGYVKHYAIYKKKINGHKHRRKHLCSIRADWEVPIKSANVQLTLLSFASYLSRCLNCLVFIVRKENSDFQNLTCKPKVLISDILRKLLDLFIKSNSCFL